MEFDTAPHSPAPPLGKPFPVPSAFQMPISRLAKVTEQSRRLARPATASLAESAPMYLPAQHLNAAHINHTTTSPDPRVSVSLRCSPGH